MFAPPRISSLHPRPRLLVCHLEGRLRTTYPLPTWRYSSSSSNSAVKISEIAQSSATPLSSLHIDKSVPHHSLSSFLSYARSTSLSTTSSVYIGTRYEYLAQDALRSLGFALHRSGGRSDGGIDLWGTWTLPGAPHALRCIVQCKALTKKVGPNLVRELEGAFAAARPGWQSDDVVGVLCATREASKGVREAVRRSGRGIVWIMLQDDARLEQNSNSNETEAHWTGAGTGKVRQVLWNERVAALGATGVGVGVVYDDTGQPQGSGADGEEPQQEVRLMWNGQVWEPDSEPEGNDSS